MKPLQMLLTMVAIVMLGCQPGQSRQEDISAVPVKIVEVHQVAMSRPIHTSGILSSDSRMNLSFKVGGIVDRLSVREGMQVREGATLASLVLEEIEAEVQQARSAFDKTQRDLQRVRSLYEDSVATLEQYQNSQTGFDLAKSRLRIAEFNRKHAEIVAPENGVILRRFVEENEMVGPGNPVFQFGTTAKNWIVTAGIPDRDVVRCAAGDSGSVWFDALGDQVYSGHITKIGGTADPLTHTFTVELTLESRDPGFRNGFIGRISIFPSETRRYWLVPMEALIEPEGSVGSVFAVTGGGTAEKVSVDIAFLTDSTAAISHGLRDGQIIVTQGAHYLKDGSRVNPAM